MTTKILIGVGGFIFGATFVALISAWRRNKLLKDILKITNSKEN